MKRAWLIGSEGMLGREIASLLRPDVRSDAEVDITDLESLRRFAAREARGGIGHIVNCAAYTTVDRAEQQPEKAFAVNADGAANVAAVACELGAALVHVSTDYVFDGAGNRPCREEDPTGPESVYGKSKLEGERRAQEILQDIYILRIAWLFGLHGRNFVSTMLDLFPKRDTVSVVDDQWGNPTYTKDAALAVQCLIREKPDPGIYHFTNEGDTTWFRFACGIRDAALERGMLSNPVELVPIETAAYPTPAKRPKYSCLSKEKIKRAAGLEIRDWQVALDDFLADIGGRK